jgi:uncharacterized protein (TIGR02598 family)
MKVHGKFGFSTGFSLVEVVLALGVVAFAIIAILGVFPVGLNASHDSQNESRAAQISQDIFSSLASQSQTKFPHLRIDQSAHGTTPAFSFNVDLDTAHTYDTLAADNNGNLVALATNTNADKVKYPYYVTLRVDPGPAGFDVNYATMITVRVAWQPFTQNYRDFVRIISKY